MKIRKLISAVAALATLLGVLTPMASGQKTTAQTSIWIGPGDSVWNDTMAWDTGIVPIGTTDSAIVGSPAPAVLNVNVDLESLLVETDGVVNVNSGLNIDFSGSILDSLTNLGTINTGNNIDFQFQGNVMNSGAITLNSTGSFTDIEVDGAAQLSGGGTITLSGSTNARLMGLNSLLTVDEQTIEGLGQIGANSLALELSADTLVNANSTDNILTIDGNATLGMTGFGVVNDGVMRASNGGILRFSNDVTDNRNGVIESLASSEVRLDSNSTIVGGLIQSVGDGQVIVPAGINTFLEDLTLDADLQTANNVDVGFTGTIENLGSVSVNSTGSFTDIEIQPDGATLTGGGTITLAGSVNARVTGISSLLTVGDQTIEGMGQIGANTMRLELGEGTLIDANSHSNTLTIDGNSALDTGEGGDIAGVVNDGMMRASNGGILRFANDTTDNRNGVIESLGHSEVRLDSNSVIVGGTIRSLDDGQVFVPSGVSTFLENLTLDADLQTETNVDLGLTGTIENLGAISLNSTGALTDIEIQAGGANITGPGTINLSGTNARIMGLNVPGEVQIIDQTIQGDGQLGANSISMAIRNGSVVDANVPEARLTIDGNASLDNVGFGTEIDGVMRASNGGILRFQSDVINNRDGVIEALAGSTVELGNLADICNGIIRTVDDGQVVVPPSQSVFLRNLPTPPFNFEFTLDADVQVGNNTDFGIEGTINNLGTISMNSTGSFTDIEIQASGATIAGGGTVVLSGANARIDGFAPVGFEEGTLTGNGQVVVDSTFDGATISPGLSIGSLRFVNSDSVFTGSTTLRHEIQSVVDNPGTTADVIDVTGQLDLDGVNIELVSLDTNGDQGDVVDFDPNVDYEFVVAIADSIVASGSFSVDLSEFSNTLNGSFLATVVPRGNREALVLQSSDAVACSASIELVNGDLEIRGTQQRDVITVVDEYNTVVVRVNDDCLESFDAADVTRVVVLSFGGGDFIDIEAAKPTFISAGFGPDEIFGGPLENEIEGGPGPDMIFGGPLNDIINAGRGIDTVNAFGGDDIVLGGDAMDTLFGGPGDDMMLGGLGGDILSGGNGIDCLVGNAGADELLGGGGDDFLSGQGGPDLLRAGGGDDELEGGEGFDTLNGGPGFDTGLDEGEVENSIENSAEDCS